MMAPVVARYYARHLLGKETHALFDALEPQALCRRRGRSSAREQMHIG